MAVGGLAVIPTDTVYGIAADAFNVQGVDMLLAAKQRGRSMPPPVLIGDRRTLDALAVDVPAVARDLIERFWPGPLTVVLRAQPSLAWDLGETGGTVALRMPAHECTLTLLRKTGPLAVSSANISGQSAATTAQDAHEQLGNRVRIYLDAGPTPGETPSTIIDATTPEVRILRAGVLSADTLGLGSPAAEAGNA